MEAEDLFPPRRLPARRALNFVIGSRPVDDLGKKAILVEVDPANEVRVGDLLEAADSRTGRHYALQVYDIEPAYDHGEQHAEMLDQLRLRPDKEIDDSSFFAVCKNMAVCSLLGEIDGDSFVDTGYRPNKYTTSAVEAGDDIEAMMVSGWDDGAPIGHLRKGREVRTNRPIHFSTLQLVGKRFAFFAQTGGGKSTAMRHLLEWHTRQMHSTTAGRRIGFMVDDFKLEYPFDTVNERGDAVPGIVTNLGPIARDRVIILTSSPGRFTERQRQQVHAVLHAQIPLDSLSLSSFADVADLTGPQANLVRLVENSGRTTPSRFFEDLFAVDDHGMPDRVRWGQRYGRMFYSDKGKKKVERGEEIDSDEDIQSGLRDRLEYIWRAAERLASLRFMTRSASQGNCIPQLLNYLRAGCTVIVDKDDLEDHERELLTVLLLHHLFRANQAAVRVSEPMVPVIYAVEEAQYLLSKDKVADPDSIFAKIAFTGRSYQIGLIAITQRPQGIQQELLGQFDGFLVLPLEHANDFKHLADAAPSLAPFRHDLASAPVGGGVLAYGKPKRVVPIQVSSYT